MGFPVGVPLTGAPAGTFPVAEKLFEVLDFCWQATQNQINEIIKSLVNLEANLHRLYIERGARSFSRRGDGNGV
jgi:hypothetical protein